MPLALVAIHPPRVENSTLSGSWPEVYPRAPSARSSSLPEIPASTQACKFSSSSQTISFIRRMSTEAKMRPSSVGKASAPLTLVPPP